MKDASIIKHRNKKEMKGKQSNGDRETMIKKIIGYGILTSLLIALIFGCVAIIGLVDTLLVFAGTGILFILVTIAVNLIYS